MRLLLLLAQLSTAAHTPLTAVDSVALVKRVEEREFQFLMDWRYIWATEFRFYRVANPKSKVKPPPYFNPKYDLRLPTGPETLFTDWFFPIPKGEATPIPGEVDTVHSGCTMNESFRLDVDRRSWAAHQIKAPNRLQQSICPVWAPPNWHEPSDERKSIDAGLTYEGYPPIAADSARLIRRPVIALLDSVAARLPGDGWIAGQRVRLHLDQGEVASARKAAAECRAEAWWCTALAGYVQYVAGDMSAASATFDRSRTMMPYEVACDWDNLGFFFPYHARRTSTLLRDQQRVGLFWELYGLATGDTVDVTLRAIRRDDSTPVQRFGAFFGFGKVGEDTVVVRWTEPRPTAPTATVEAGVTIRPSGLTLDISAFNSGRYTLELAVQRRAGVTATTKREFRIQRP